MRTNRELYRFVLDLAARHANEDRTLEQYLCALWSLIQNRLAATLPLAEFGALLERAFTSPPGAPSLDAISDDNSDGVIGCEQTILEQIRDLHDMAANGQLDDDQRYFGIDAPSGRRWYNFDPSGYLECATQGTFGGWDDDEGEGRVAVPGKVAVMNEHGDLVSVDPSEIERPVVEIDVVDWDTFTSFLRCGQYYE